jgi:hypothetical protein
MRPYPLPAQRADGDRPMGLKHARNTLVVEHQPGFYGMRLGTSAVIIGLAFILSIRG